MHEGWRRTVTWCVLAVCGTVMYTAGTIANEAPSGGSMSEACQRIGFGFLACSTLALVAEMVVAGVRANAARRREQSPRGFDVLPTSEPTQKRKG